MIELSLLIIYQKLYHYKMSIHCIVERHGWRECERDSKQCEHEIIVWCVHGLS